MNKRSYFFNHRGGISLLKALILLILLFALLYFRPWLNDKQKAEWAHGITLVGSALKIQTVGDWRRAFLDRGATTIFTLDTKEIEKFMSTLPEVRPDIGVGPPSNKVYHRGLDMPWNTEQKPSHSSSFGSPVGDWLSVEVYKLDEGESAIRLYTDWN